MNILNASQFARTTETLLLLRGAQPHPLQWQTNPNRAAKQNLDAITEDASLFGAKNLKDEAMAAAVRALLYLWNGWTTECAMYGQAAPQAESHYISALCERHLGRPQVAKEHLQDVADHPILVPLGKHAVRLIARSSEPLLKRFSKLVDMGGIWEAFAFSDLYEQACAGKIARAAQETVCTLQCVEFELLLQYCYEQTTGVPLRKIPVPTEQPKRRRRPVPSPTKRRTSAARKETAAPRNARLDKKPDPPAQPSSVAIACPKCRHKQTFPASARGKSHRCGACGAGFLVPDKRGLSSSVGPSRSPGTIAIVCPKCRATVVLPESARGRQGKCNRCATAFSIPEKPSPTAKPVPSR